MKKKVNTNVMLQKCLKITNGNQGQTLQGQKDKYLQTI